MLDSNEAPYKFEFDFEGSTRESLLNETRDTFRALQSDLGPDQADADPLADAANRLLTQLDQEIAEFGKQPDVVRLQEEHFTLHGLRVPIQFKELSKTHRFYWMRLPLILHAMQDMPFTKLECAVEFRSDVGEGKPRPRALMILPDCKFQKLLEMSDSIEIKIGENLAFEASGSVASNRPMTATVDAKVAAGLGVVAGPFTYTLKKAVIEHSPPGTEKVFWRLVGTETLEDDTSLIVVLQVPRDVAEVSTVAALQAYHRVNVLTADLSQVFSALREKVASFFKQGAPKKATQQWTLQTAD